MSETRLIPSSRRVSSLSHRQVDEMYALFERYYDRADPERFRADLGRKQQVILLTHPRSAAICGFSTLRVMEPAEIGQPCRLIYSGDTVIDSAYWGQKALHRGFARHLLTLRLRTRLPLYWLLTTKGYKTYLLLAHWFPDAWPRYDREMPLRVRALRDHVGHTKYGSDYDPEHGVIRLAGKRDRLKPGTADIGGADRSSPHIAFFERANPGHADGDELLCLARVRWRDPPRIIARLTWRQLSRPVRTRGAGSVGEHR